MFDSKVTKRAEGEGEEGIREDLISAMERK
jgi:hypothetical protein